MTTERLIRPSVAAMVPSSAPAAARDGIGLLLIAVVAVLLAAAVGTSSFAFPVLLLAVLFALVFAERRLRER